MKLFRHILFAFVAALGAAFAQDEERRGPPIEIPDFSNLDEYIYEPRSVLAFGFRYISGAKTSFSGTGRIPSPENPGAATGANLLRVYHNGRVQPDARTVARLDGGGNPVGVVQVGARVGPAVAAVEAAGERRGNADTTAPHLQRR